MIAEQISHYRIINKIGAGGMGVVWLAEDTRLNRKVAIKLLPAEFAKDADRLSRFEQEARATSALNHPNILTLYDIGAHDGAPFIVAELLEGEILRAQLPPQSEAGPLPARKAIEYAQQIASGLAAAHGKGIVHRDLKPENLFVTTDGRVKILDFGLAKLKPQQIGAADSQAPTQKKITDPGTVMGTVGYMSPEQVRGQEADHRADIFSFGVILYEMLSGRRAFSGESAIEVMNAILKEDPPELAAMNHRVPLRVNATGGKPEPATELDAANAEIEHSFPSFLPDGRHFLFQVIGRDNGIYVGSLDTRDHKLLIPLGSDIANSTRAVWSPPGYILYALNRTTLMARAFDPDRLELKGEPFRVAENLRVVGPGIAPFTVSANGVLAFAQSGDADTIQLTWRDRGAKRLGVAGPAAPWINLMLSPDERFAAVVRQEPNRLNSLWLLDLRQDAARPFVSDGGNNFPVWAPDGKQLAFSSLRNSKMNLFLKPLAGNAPEERLPDSPYTSSPTSWTPHGNFLIFRMLMPQTGNDIWMLPMSGARKPRLLFRTKANDLTGLVSPDGHWLAYVSDETGSMEVYMTQFPQPARSWLVSRSGGLFPFWRSDGKELFFVAGNNIEGYKLMTASVGAVSGEAEFHAGAPQVLFELEGTNLIYAPSRDGQRFLVGVVTERAPPPPINVVMNWAAEAPK